MRLLVPKQILCHVVGDLNKLALIMVKAIRLSFGLALHLLLCSKFIPKIEILSWTECLIILLTLNSAKDKGKKRAAPHINCAYALLRRKKAKLY